VALIRIPPTPARVTWDRRTDRPARVRWADADMAVTGVAAVRDERHAYRADAGPRMTMTVTATHGTAVLVFDSRRRRWFVEAVDLAA
jgi:hypothetical protein